MGHQLSTTATSSVDTCEKIISPLTEDPEPAMLMGS